LDERYIFFPKQPPAPHPRNGLEPRDVDRGYRWEQGFTLEMYMHEDSQKARDAFVETGKVAKF
jgi:enoyl-CoA hydratase